MARYVAVSSLTAVLFASGCTSAELEQSQISNEHTALLDDEVIRGFIVRGDGCSTLGDPLVNGNTVTFILGDYVAQRAGRGTDKASCDLVVEVSLPAGTGLNLDEVVYRGFADGSDSRTAFSRQYHFGGQVHGRKRTTVQEYDAEGNATLVRDDSDQYTSEFGEFTAADVIPSVGPAVCGRRAKWRANTTFSVQNSQDSSFSLASIDTVDLESQFTATFEFLPQSCR
jgi:Domain of unknown function (DUF4360)